MWNLIGGLEMINSVSFRNVPSADLYSAPQRFQRQTPYTADAPEEKKSSGVGKKIAIGVGVAAAIATALAILAKKGKLDPKTLEEGANFLQKGWEGAKKGMKVAGDFIADKSVACWNAVKNLISKKAEVPTPPAA